MTRVTNLGQHQSLLQSLMRNQETVFDSNRKIATGKKVVRFDGLGIEAPSLLATKAVKSRILATIEANRLVDQRLEMNNMALGSLADIADSLRQVVITASGQNSGLALMANIRGLFERALDVINTRFDGRHIFAGTRTDTPPFNAGSEAELLALAMTSDGFDNNQKVLSAEVDEGRTLRYGVLASDIAEGLFDGFRRLMQFENGTMPPAAAGGGPAGSFGTELTIAQRDFLLGELGTIATTIQTLRNAEAANGVRMNELDKLTNSHGDELVFLETFISEIENVDMAEAVSKLTQDQTALEAAIQVMARLSRVSLLDFI